MFNIEVVNYLEEAYVYVLFCFRKSKNLLGVYMYLYLFIQYQD